MGAMRLSHLGLRAQIVLSLAALLAVVFSFAAVAVLWVLKASVEGQRRELGEVAGRAVVLRVADRARDGLAPGALARLLSDTVGRGGVLSIAVYDGQGELVAARGVEGEGLALVGVDPRRPRSFAVVRRGEGGREEMLLVEPLGGGRGSVAAVVALETSGADLGRLARPVLIHLVTSGLLLLGFGYYSLTRLIVRPLETLTRATEKVAGGRLDVVIAVQGGWEIAAAARAFNDMTKRLRDQQDRLAQKVDELEQASEALGATQEQLVRSAKLASVGSLAAGLAHEVGNPVSAVLGLTEVLLDGGLEPHEEREYLERIRKETERVNRIVRDLLEYARSSPDDDDEPADVAEAVDSAVGLR